MNHDNKSHKDPVLLQQVDNVTYAPKPKSKLTKDKVVAFVVLLVGVILLIIGIALIASSESSCKQDKTTASANQHCSYSDEAKRVNLGDFLDHVRQTYFRLHPFNIFHNDEIVTADQAREGYGVYDASPTSMKTKTDTALQLLKEIQQRNINIDKLKPRERKSLSQVKHYLTNMFGEPYDVNYYAGDWMLGPNSFCWQVICYIPFHIHNSLLYFVPTNLPQLKFLLKTIKDHKNPFDQYVENLKLGVTKGMVRSIEECKAGYDAISRTYFNISLHNESGMLSMRWFVIFFNQLSVTFNDMFEVLVL